jgi:hypothetical protein
MLQVEHARRECDMSELNREISLESLYGGRIAPAEAVLEGMRPLEQALNAEFHEQQDRTLQVQGRLANELRSEPSGTVDAQRLPETIRLARDRYSSIQDRELPSPVWAPETQRIFTGSIGATVVPPYDYQWTWSATTAGATIQALSADSSKGAVLFTKASFDADPASVSARGAVGIFFRPVVTNGILRISSNPSVGTHPLILMVSSACMSAATRWREASTGHASTRRATFGATIHGGMGRPGRALTPASLSVPN